MSPRPSRRATRAPATATECTTHRRTNGVWTSITTICLALPALIFSLRRPPLKTAAHESSIRLWMKCRCIRSTTRASASVNETPWKSMLKMPQLVEHPCPQDFVQPALIAAPLTLEPFDHVGIYAHRQLSLHGTIEFSALCSAPVTLSRRRHVGEVDLALRLGGQGRQFLANGLRDLAHKLSSQAWLHV